MNKRFPIMMTWIPLKNSTYHKVPYLRDEYLLPIDSMCKFLLAIADWKYTFSKLKSREQAYKSHIDMYAYAMKSLVEFLSTKTKITWSDMSDDLLNEYYDWEVPRIMSQSATKHDTKTAQRTCNRKLTVIYQFYGWAHSVGKLLPNGYIGENGRIKTTIPVAYKKGLFKGPIVKVPHKKYPDIANGLYPLLRDHIGKPSGDYAATQNDIENLLSHFADNNTSSFITMRNILITNITDQVGLRSNSIASLTVDQFKSDDIESSSGDYIGIKPSQQKLGYNNIFDFPKSLVSNIIDYIEDERAVLIKRLGLNERKLNHILFITENGAPITPKRISEIMTKAFQSIGVEAGKGAGAHSGRRKKAIDVTDRELAWRARLGMPIDPVTIGTTVAQALGQHNIESPTTYHKSTNRMQNENLESKLARHNAELLGEIQELRKEKAHLEYSLRKIEKNND